MATTRPRPSHRTTPDRRSASLEGERGHALSRARGPRRMSTSWRIFSGRARDVAAADGPESALSTRKAPLFRSRACAVGRCATPPSRPESSTNSALSTSSLRATTQTPRSVPGSRKITVSGRVIAWCRSRRESGDGVVDRLFPGSSSAHARCERREERPVPAVPQMPFAFDETSILAEGRWAMGDGVPRRRPCGCLPGSRGPDRGPRRSRFRNRLDRIRGRSTEPQKPRSPEHLAAFRAIPGKGNSALCTREVDSGRQKCRRKNAGPEKSFRRLEGPLPRSAAFDSRGVPPPR